MVYIYTLLEIIGGVAEFAITLTKGAVGFPGVLLFLAFCAKMGMATDYTER